MVKNVKYELDSMMFFFSMACLVFASIFCCDADYYIGFVLYGFFIVFFIFAFKRIKYVQKQISDY